MARGIGAITLDLDNTLWDVFPTLSKAEENHRSYLSQHYPRVTERYSVEDVPKVRERIFNSRPDIQHDMTELRRQVYRELLTQCEYDPLDADVLLELFLVDRNKVELFPDVLPALSALSERYPLVSLTDGNSDLEVIGIRDFFVDCVHAADVGHYKPHPAGFIKACEIAGFEPHEVIHVGDHPIADIDGARRAGLQTMWMQRNGEKWEQDFEPDYRISSLIEAVEILC